MAISDEHLPEESLNQQQVRAPIVRIEEYKAVMEDYAQLSARRQNTNAVYVGINTLLLTGIGLLLVSVSLENWPVVAAIAAITLAIMPINVTWYRSLRHYMLMVDIHFTVLMEIEQELQNLHERRQTGVFQRMSDAYKNKWFGSSLLEKRLAIYFLGLYPTITLLVAIVVYLSANHIIQTLEFK
jgi:hypothetical protein